MGAQRVQTSDSDKQRVPDLGEKNSNSQEIISDLLYNLIGSSLAPVPPFHLGWSKMCSVLFA